MTRILIVDDEENYRENFKKYLQEYNFECFEAGDGLEALVKTEEVNPNIILLDVDMPDIDGLEVCRRIKAHKKTRDIPVVFISGVDKYLKQQLHCLEIGGDAYIEKPFDFNELLDVINRLLKGEKILKDLVQSSQHIEVSDQITQKVFGGYKILEFIGTGWMCTIYKTLQLSLNRIVSLRVFSRRLSKDYVFISNFETETKRYASLDHPNIVSIIDKGKEGEFYYFTTEYIQGKSLSYYFRNMDLDIPHYICIIVELGRAVHYLHKHNIIHKFLNPHRIIVDTNGILKLSDFSFSTSIKFLSEHRHDFLRDDLGYFDYQSPEQKQDSNLCNIRSDIYSLGAIFYEMFTGKKAFKDFVNPSLLNPLLNKQIDEILFKSLDPKQENRYSSVPEFCQNLLNILDRASSRSITTATTDRVLGKTTNIFEELKPKEKISDEGNEIPSKVHKPIKIKNNLLMKGILFVSFIFILSVIIVYGISFSLKIENSRINKKQQSVLPVIKFDPILKLSGEENFTVKLSAKNIDGVKLFYREAKKDTKFEGLEFESQNKEDWKVILPENVITENEIEYFLTIKFGDKIQSIPPKAPRQTFTLSFEK